MIATLWLSDIGRLGGLRARTPEVGSVDGLLFSAGGVRSKLRRGQTPRLMVGHAIWFALWEDEPAFDRFAIDNPGPWPPSGRDCLIRLTPDRIIQRNIPGLADRRPSEGDAPIGPVLIVTVNRPKRHRLVRFLRAAVPAEQAAAARDDLRWAAGFSRPPGRFATVTLWDSAEAAADYAYGQHQPAHRKAIEAEAQQWFVWTLNVRARVDSIEGDPGDDSAIDHMRQLGSEPPA